MYHDLYNEHSGIVQNFRNFYTTYCTREEDRKLYDRQMKARSNWLLAIATALLLLVGTVVAVMTYERTNHTQIHFPGPHAEAYDASMAVE